MYNIHISSVFLGLFTDIAIPNFTTSNSWPRVTSWLCFAIIITRVYNYCFTNQAFFGCFSRLPLFFLSRTTSSPLPLLAISIIFAETVSFFSPQEDAAIKTMNIPRLNVLFPIIALDVFWYSPPHNRCANIAPHQRNWG